MDRMGRTDQISRCECGQGSHFFGLALRVWGWVWRPRRSANAGDASGGQSGPGYADPSRRRLRRAQDQYQPFGASVWRPEFRQGAAPHACRRRSTRLRRVVTPAPPTPQTPYTAMPAYGTPEAPRVRMPGDPLGSAYIPVDSWVYPAMMRLYSHGLPGFDVPCVAAVYAAQRAAHPAEVGGCDPFERRRAGAGDPVGAAE